MLLACIGFALPRGAPLAIHVPASAKQLWFLVLAAQSQAPHVSNPLCAGGQGASGGLGTGNKNSSNVPILVSGNLKWKAVTVAYGHTCELRQLCSMPSGAEPAAGAEAGGRRALQLVRRCRPALTVSRLCACRRAADEWQRVLLGGCCAQCCTLPACLALVAWLVVSQAPASLHSALSG